MTTSKLDIYNGALLKAGAGRKTTLTEESDRRRWLDEVWDDGGVDHCLEAGQWLFATRSSKLDYDTAIEPNWGYRRAFAKPTDWLLTTAVCSDEYFRNPLLQYTDEAGILYADLEELYVKYVSNDTTYGGDYSLWPQSFTEYVKAYFAWRISPNLHQRDQEQEDALERKMTKALRDAKNRNQIGLPTKFPAQGAWNSSRQGRMSNTRDRGNSGSLIG